MALTRRRLLQAGSIVTISVVAGCSGNGSEPGTVTTTATTGSESETTESGTTTEEKTDNEFLSAPTIGDENAPVVVKSFEDFTCGFCQEFTLETLPQVKAEFIDSGEVRFERHDYPFLDEEWSWKAAHAARAVQDAKGDEAFFEYADLLYQNIGSYSVDRFAELAEVVEVDPAFVRDATAEGRYQETLEADKALGDEKNVAETGTPSVFVDGELVQSSDFWPYASAINEALADE